MEIIQTIQGVRDYSNQWRYQHKQSKVGFVPTMGFLHEGHASLIETAKQQCDFVVVSIFVNPLQFGPNEDFDRYPRDHEGDLRLAKQSGADLVFMPSIQEMYPTSNTTIVKVNSNQTTVLCGASRPGHFEGVTTVVMKLLGIVQPNQMFLGMKDAQQLAVITKMTEDLNIPVDIIACPTVRENDGLAKSSRNVYLSPEERKQAVILYQSLQQVKQWWKQSGSVSYTRKQLMDTIQTMPLAVIDYVDMLTYPSLLPIIEPEADLTPSIQPDLAPPIQQIIAAVAVRFGTTRLIDNIIFTIQGGVA